MCAKLIDFSLCSSLRFVVILGLVAGPLWAQAASTPASGGTAGPQIALGFRLLSVGDLTGDGIPEYVISRHEDNPTGTAIAGTFGPGAIEFRDGATDLMIWQRYGAGPGDVYGRSMGLVDWNGDGVLEIAVVAHALPKIEILDAVAGTVITTLAWPAGAATAYVGESMSHGDIDGDGLEELLVSASPVALGSFTNVNQPGQIVQFSPTAAATMITSALAGFAKSLQVMPDLNGDGHREILVGSDWHSPLVGGTQINSAGILQVLSGISFNTIWQITGPAAGAAFGRKIALLGDLDSDLVPDIAVVDSSLPIRLRIVSGVSGATINQFNLGTELPLTSDLTTIADVNGDNWPELVTAIFGPAPTVRGGYALYSLLDGSLVDFADSARLSGFGPLRIMPTPDTNGDGRREILMAQSTASAGMGASQRFEVKPALPQLATGNLFDEYLWVNGGTGGPAHRVDLATGQAFTITVAPSAQVGLPADFILWGLIGVATTNSAYTVPGGPTFLFPPRVAAPNLPWLFCLADTLGFDPLAAFPATSMPWTLAAPFGLPMPIDITLQAVCVLGSTIDISNGILLHVR